MRSKGLFIAVSIAVSVIGSTQAADTGAARAALQLAQSIPEEPVYGSHMMTQQERDAHHARLRAAGTEQEREQIRREHHAQMQARAKEHGMSLPDEPPPRGTGGSRPGAGAGSGVGPGPGPGAGPRGGGTGR
jgi:hypothetical protein